MWCNASCFFGKAKKLRSSSPKRNQNKERLKVSEVGCRRSGASETKTKNIPKETTIIITIMIGRENVVYGKTPLAPPPVWSWGGRCG